MVQFTGVNANLVENGISSKLEGLYTLTGFIG